MSESSGEIRQIVLTYLLEEFLQEEDPDSIDGRTPLISSGVLDSIATAKLVSFLESRFAIRFKASEVAGNHLETIDQIVGLTARKIEASA